MGELRGGKGVAKGRWGWLWGGREGLRGGGG